MILCLKWENNVAKQERGMNGLPDSVSQRRESGAGVMLMAQQRGNATTWLLNERAVWQAGNTIYGHTGESGERKNFLSLPHCIYIYTTNTLFLCFSFFNVRFSPPCPTSSPSYREKEKQHIRKLIQTQQSSAYRHRHRHHESLWAWKQVIFHFFSPPFSFPSLIFWVMLRSFCFSLCWVAVVVMA